MKVSELIEKYSEGREKIAELKREFEAKEKEIKEYMAKIAKKLQEYAKAQGLENLQTPNFTMYWSKHSFPRITNSEDFYDYMIKNKRFDLLERRVAKLTTMEMIEQGEIIPGIEVYSEIKPNLRKVS